MIWRTYVTVTLCIKPIYLWLSFCQIPLLSTAGGCGNCPGPRENYSGRWSELVMAEDDCLSAAPRKPCSLGLHRQRNGSLQLPSPSPIRRPYDATKTALIEFSFVSVKTSLWSTCRWLSSGDRPLPVPHVHGLLLDNSIHDCMACGSAMMDGADAHTTFYPCGPVPAPQQ